MSIESALKLARMEAYVRERERVYRSILESDDVQSSPGDFGIGYMQGKLTQVQELILEYFLTSEESAEIAQVGREMFG